MHKSSFQISLDLLFSDHFSHFYVKITFFLSIFFNCFRFDLQRPPHCRLGLWLHLWSCVARLRQWTHGCGKQITKKTLKN